MKAGGSKAKGSEFERKVCKELSKWVSGGERTDLFWRSVPGFENYRISEYGHVVRGNNIWDRRLLKPFGKDDDYLYVDLFKNGIRKRFSIHRLVAIAFLSEQCNGLLVTHKDGNKYNNHWTNLKWATQKDNIQDAMKHGTFKKPPICKGSNNSTAKLTEDDVRKIRLLSINGKTQEYISKEFCVSRSTIRDILIGRSWSHVL